MPDGIAQKMYLLCSATEFHVGPLALVRDMISRNGIYSIESQ